MRTFLKEAYISGQTDGLSGGSHDIHVTFEIRFEWN